MPWGRNSPPVGLLLTPGYSPDAGLLLVSLPFAIWVTLWAIIVIAALALIITVVAWFAIP